MVKLTATDGEPLWVNVDQICAIKRATDTAAAETEIHVPGRELRCTELVDEVLQTIVEAING
jgi:uncharacterized protein YlzI (FlbEa/FlbD family)